MRVTQATVSLSNITPGTLTGGYVPPIRLSQYSSEDTLAADTLLTGAPQHVGTVVPPYIDNGSLCLLTIRSDWTLGTSLPTITWSVIPDPTSAKVQMLGEASANLNWAHQVYGTGNLTSITRQLVCLVQGPITALWVYVKSSLADSTLKAGTHFWAADLVFPPNAP